MKTISRIIWALILFVSVVQSHAIEGIQVSLQSSNVVLSWPSLTNETYIAQYRHTLNSTDNWVTLTNYFPATQNTNLTQLIISNSVDFGTLGGGDGTNTGVITPPSPGETNDDSSGTNETFGTPGTGFYRVVRDGVHMWGLTNGMVVSNVLLTSIEFAVDSTDEVVGVSFFDTNDVPIIGANAQKVGGDRWLLTWNTLLSFNGNYTFYAELNFASDAPVVSQPVTLTVSNVISFPNYFSQVYGSQMWIYAQTIPNAAYEIDIYDENTNYLGSFDDYADSGGTISFLWNLVDGNGITHNDTNFLGVFSVDTSDESPEISKLSPHFVAAKNFATSAPSQRALSYKFKPKGIGAHPDAGGTTATANQLWVKEGTWTPNNYWVLAYAPLTDPNTDPNTSLKESYVMLGGSDGEYTGVIGALDAYGLRGNLSPGNVPQSSAFELADTNSRAQLLSYLASSPYENFYYLGHGNESAIGSFNSASTAITASQISFALGNIPLSMNSGPPTFDQGWDPDLPTMYQPTMPTEIQHAALHPYRLVFLDGCETGRGNFCESFGIPAVTVNTNFFASAGVESRAFIGYTQPIYFDPAQWTWRSLTLGGFFEDWLSGLSVQNCVGNAQAGAHSSGFEPMDSSAIINGAVDMTQSTRTRP